jgi:hypothetical protein
MALVAVAKHAAESPSLLPRCFMLNRIIGLGVLHDIRISGRPGREFQGHRRRGGVHRLASESIFLVNIYLWGSLHALPVTL